MDQKVQMEGYHGTIKATTMATTMMAGTATWELKQMETRVEA